MCDDVAQAANIAVAFVAARAEAYGRDSAVRQIARDIKVPAARVKALLQPSRRPKSIDHGFFGRLSRAYLAYLRRRTLELEAEIKRVEAIASLDDRAIHDLETKAANITARIEVLKQAIRG